MIDKGFLVLLALVLLAAVSPGAAWAGGGKAGTAAEENDYSSREAQSQGLDQFAGGSVLGVLVVILLLAGIAVLVYFLFFSDDPWIGEPRTDVQPTPDRTLAK